MNTVTPIIIPMHRTSKPERCPSCKAVESKKIVCAHCGHEYKKEDLTLLDVFFIIISVCLVVGVVFYIILTMGEWLGSYRNPSLVDVLKSQWEWLKNIKVF